MTKTKAIKQAINESGMHRQGRDWIYYHWVDDMNCTRTSNSMDYFHCRSALKSWRAVRAAKLMGATDTELFILEYNLSQS